MMSMMVVISMVVTVVMVAQPQKVEVVAQVLGALAVLAVSQTDPQLRVKRFVNDTT